MNCLPQKRGCMDSYFRHFFCDKNANGKIPDFGQEIEPNALKKSKNLPPKFQFPQQTSLFSIMILAK